MLFFSLFFSSWSLFSLTGDGVRLLLNRKELLGTSGTSSAATVLNASVLISSLSPSSLLSVAAFFAFFFAFFFSFLLAILFCFFSFFFFFDRFLFVASSDEESLCDSSSELELESSELLESESCFLFAFFFSAFFPVPLALAFGISSPQLLTLTSLIGRLFSSIT